MAKKGYRVFGAEGEHRLARLLLVPCNQRLSNPQLAEMMGVSKDTIQKYKAAALRLMETWQMEPIGPADIVVIERALLVGAQAGNVTAARILFERLKDAGLAGGVKKPPEEQPLPTVEELEEALAMLKIIPPTTP